ncbi:hypothetical protein ACLBWZ_08985 [Brucellaceae bacterium C25G]
MAAYSKAQKLKAKRGRPTLPAAEREANGRKSRRKSAVVLRLVETEREVKSVAVANRVKLGMTNKEADSQEAGSVLGRLYLNKGNGITKAQYDAGMLMAKDFARYYALTGIPFPSIKAHDIGRVSGRNETDNQSAIRAATNRVMLIEKALGEVDHSGKPITSTTKKVCVLDEADGMHLPHMVNYLKHGLKALIKLYGI